MDSFSAFARGKCLEMCPMEEMKMREKERLLHVLEIIPGTEKNPKADPNRVVKEFSRSAAGKQINENNLRPPDVLLKTVSYLLFDVIDVHHLPWHLVYDFITDRLRAVRQDMVIQNVSNAETISILQPIIRFHAYAAYRLCCEDISRFDPVLNRNHLQECLKKLLSLYDHYDNLLINQNFLLGSGDNYLLDSRIVFEALYVLLNLGDEEAIWRNIKLPKRCRTFLVQNAFHISFSYRTGNIVKACKLISNLTHPLLAITASLHLPQIRKKAFRIMSVAYNSSSLAFDLNDLKDILLYSDESDLIQDCKYYGFCVTDSSGIIFTKSSFNNNSAIKPRQERFVNEKLEKECVQSLVMDIPL